MVKCDWIYMQTLVSVRCVFETITDKLEGKRRFICNYQHLGDAFLTIVTDKLYENQLRYM